MANLDPKAVDELEADVAEIVGRWQAENPNVAVTVGIKLAAVTARGIVKRQITLTDIPAYEQKSLFNEDLIGATPANFRTLHARGGDAS